MSSNLIANPFEMKRDVNGKLIPPDFLDAEIPNAPVVPTVDQVRSSGVVQEPQEDQQEETLEQPQTIEEVADKAEEVASVEGKQPTRMSRPPKEHNLRRLREDLERERSEKELMAREIEMYRRTGYNNQNTDQVRGYAPEPRSSEADINEVSIGDDDLVEGKHLKKIIQQMQAKIDNSNQQYAQQVQQSHQAALEMQLKSQYPDFDSVVNQGNLKDLAAAYPELASTIYASKDLRSQAVTAYTMIKNLGINQEAQEDTYMADRERVKKNAAKPRPSTSTAATHTSPLSQASTFAGDLTPALKAQMVREMEQFRQR